MATTRSTSARLLPGGTPLRNQLLAAAPQDLYAAIVKDLRMVKVAVGNTLQENGAPVSHVYFPNGGVYSVINEMRDGALVEVATVGTEGMLGVNVLLGDRLASGRSLQQVPNGLLPRMTVGHFARHAAEAGPFRAALMRYAQANFLQAM